MNAKHTPGPWEIGGSLISFDGKPVGFVLHNPESTKGLGKLWPRDCDRFAPRLPEADANARLIAAAPDLLDALRYIVEWNPDNWSAERARDLARAAIAKAEGVEP